MTQPTAAEHAAATEKLGFDPYDPANTGQLIEAAIDAGVITIPEPGGPSYSVAEVAADLGLEAVHVAGLIAGEG